MRTVGCLLMRMISRVKCYSFKNEPVPLCLCLFSYLLVGTKYKYFPVAFLVIWHFKNSVAPKRTKRTLIIFRRPISCVGYLKVEASERKRRKVESNSNHIKKFHCSPERVHQQKYVSFHLLNCSNNKTNSDQ